MYTAYFNAHLESLHRQINKYISNLQKNRQLLLSVTLSMSLNDAGRHMKSRLRTEAEGTYPSHAEDSDP